MMSRTQRAYDRREVSMRFVFFALLLASACSTRPAPPDMGGLVCHDAGGGGWVTAFPHVDAPCASDADCSYAVYPVDCCGSLRATGARVADVAALNAIGQSCGGSTCGCRGGLQTDDLHALDMNDYG